ncbi:S24/S26 family peptidase [bacterium]|nr:S24/S26 family peptidase [bacterium]
MSLEVQKIPFQGHSMDPLLAKADYVLVDFSNQKKPSIGEIILYRDQNKEWVCHRLINEDETHFWLKGDANTTADILQKGVELGVVRGAIRGDVTYQVTAKIFTPLICFLQFQQIKTNSYFVKKFYRSLLKVFLYLDNF